MSNLKDGQTIDYLEFGEIQQIGCVQFPIKPDRYRNDSDWHAELQPIKEVKIND